MKTIEQITSPATSGHPLLHIHNENEELYIVAK